MRSQNAVLRYPFPHTGSCDTAKKLRHSPRSSSALKFLPFLALPASNVAIVALTTSTRRTKRSRQRGKNCRDQEGFSETRETHRSHPAPVGPRRRCRARQCPLEGAVTVRIGLALTTICCLNIHFGVVECACFFWMDWS